MSDTGPQDEAEASQRIRNEELEAFAEVLLPDRDINDGINVDLTTSISTAVTKSEVESTANIHIRANDGDVEVEIVNDDGGVCHPSALTFLSGSPDDLEIIGRQMILTARYARNVAVSTE